MKIKLCGMFRECDIDYANEAKPDYIGFVLEFPKSHRSVDFETAKRLRTRLAPGIKAVGVFVDSPETTCAEYANRDIRDVIQRLGSEGADYISRLRKLVPPEVLFVSESGIRTAADVAALRENGTNAVLIGETLMRSPEKKAALAELRGR